MLIKSADDKSKRLTLLEALQDAAVLDGEQKAWVGKELWALKEGIRGERDAAHYLNNHFSSDDNLAVIHDLRLLVNGEVAQIDHLLISRGFVFYLLETKQYNGDLHINEFGEFSVSYGKGKPWGIPSPLEQSRRHQNVLVKILDELGIGGRFQKQPHFRHVVLVNPKAHIHRPSADAFDSSNVIKADQFASWREKYVHGELSVLKTLGLIANLRGTHTVKEWAQSLCEQHRPLDLSALPEFMKPREASKAYLHVQPLPVSAPFKVAEPLPAFQVAVSRRVCAACDKPLTAAEQAFCTNNVALFNGSMLCMSHQKALRQTKAAGQPLDSNAHQSKPNDDAPDPRKRKLICCACETKISFEEGRFCWNNERRFGGLQYCRPHQAAYREQRS